MPDRFEGGKPKRLVERWAEESKIYETMPYVEDYDTAEGYVEAMAAWAPGTEGTSAARRANAHNWELCMGAGAAR